MVQTLASCYVCCKVQRVCVLFKNKPITFITLFNTENPCLDLKKNTMLSAVEQRNTIPANMAINHISHLVKNHWNKARKKTESCKESKWEAILLKFDNITWHVKGVKEKGPWCSQGEGELVFKNIMSWANPWFLSLDQSLWGFIWKLRDVFFGHKSPSWYHG